MNPSIILMIVFGLLVLFYGFVAYKCAANWHIAEILLLVGIFLASAGFAVLAALSLKTHQYWHAQHTVLERDLQQVQQELDLRQHGDLLGTGSEIVSLPAAEGRLNRSLIDRGRIWRNVVVQEIAEGSITLDMSSWGEAGCVSAGVQEDDRGIVPEADPAAAAVPGELRQHNIIPHSVLFAFAETSVRDFNEIQRQAVFPDRNLPKLDEQGLCRLPAFYLGQFRVVESTDRSLIVQPLVALDPSQQQAIQAGQGKTLVLYDVLPRDGHDVFADAEKAALASILTLAGEAVEAVDYEALLNEYLRDGKPAEQTDAPERIEQEIEFLLPHTILVDVEGATSGFEKSFDSTGRALLANLWQSGPREFAVEERAWFNGVTASELVNNGIAKFTDVPPRFVRTLRSYEDLFREQRERTEAIAAQTEVITVDTQTITAAAALVRDRNAYRREERDKLASDLSKFQEELEIINRYVRQLESQVKQLRRNIRQTAADNLSLVDG